MFIVSLVVASIQTFSSIATARYMTQTLDITGTPISEPLYFGIVAVLTILPTLLVWPARVQLDGLTLSTDLVTLPLPLRAKLAFIAAPLTAAIGMLNQFGTLPNCFLLLIAAFVVYVMAFVSFFAPVRRRTPNYQPVPIAAPTSAQARKGGLLQ